MVLDGTMHGRAFLAYVEQVLVPTLAPGDVVSHRAGRRSTALLAGLQPRLQPAKLKTFLKKHAPEPSVTSGTPSPAASTPSPQSSASTTFRLPDMTVTDRKML